MTHQPASTHTTVRRSLVTLAAAASLALLGALGTACMDPGEYEDDYELYAAVDCAKIPTWAPGLQIKGVNDQVQLGGKVFGSLIGAYTVVNDPSWAPPTPTLWRQVAQCGGVQQPTQPTQPTPPAPPPPQQQPPQQQQPPAPPPPTGGVCLQNGKPAPFDPAGVKNVGFTDGRQFIGGQCTSNANCASGCCALPCGICSGPGAQFQNGKQGCGFGG